MEREGGWLATLLSLASEESPVVSKGAIPCNWPTHATAR